MRSGANRFTPNMSPDEIIAAMNMDRNGRTEKKPPTDGERELIQEFKMLLLESTDRKKVYEQYLYLQDHPITHFNKKLKLDFDIQKIRFHVMNGDMETAEQTIKDVRLYDDSMDDEQKYFWYKHLGNFYYYSGDFPTAFENYVQSEKLIKNDFSRLEIGDLYYSLGITATQFWETEKSLKYTEMALKIYQQEFVPKRIAECHLNLGITQSRLRNFKLAIDHNHAAQKIGQELDSNLLRFFTEHNYGSIYFQFQNYQMSIEHISKSLDYIPSEYVKYRLLCYCGLIKSSYELGKIDLAKNWLDKSSSLIDNMDSEEIESNNVLEVYTEYRVLKCLLTEQDDEYERIIINEWIPILISLNDLYELGYYYSQLGSYYLKKLDYENAALMLKEASKSFQRLMTIN